METKKILLNSKKSKESSNEENLININMESKTRLVPIDRAEKTIDEYKQYLNEKKKSKKYRLSFNINPFCSNVLFNNISEIVYKEGSDDCKFAYGKDVIAQNKNSEYNWMHGIEGIQTYLTYKGQDNKDIVISREDMIRDTGFSHPDIGPLVYHCGYDIFNNHTLRQKEFGVINKLKKDEKIEKRKNFNTISDYKRHHYGDIVNEKTIVKERNDYLTYNKKELHQYQVSNILTFYESIGENLIEENGWIGFINPNSVEIPNYTFNSIDGEKKISLNKCMNNNKSNEFIDMYPDRSLFSFIPKNNKYRYRKEPNWDYCLTFPYRNKYNHELVQYDDNEISINGLKVNLVGLSITKEINDNGDVILIYNTEENELITFKTIIRNNFSDNAMIDFTFVGKKDGIMTVKTIDYPTNIVTRGYNREGYEYYFSVNDDSVIDTLNFFDDPSSVEIRVRQIIDGVACEYYFREFKKIPKLSIYDIPVNKENYKDIIDKVKNCDFNSTLSKMGFSETIYGDAVTQILYNDDIDLELLRDNLGREVSEIYLTIVKNNKGHKEWYDSKNYGSKKVTFSHCFGKITSGIDIIDENVANYNIHKMHNLDTSLAESIGENKGVYEEENVLSHPFKDLFVKENYKYKNPEVLEDDITIDDDIFLGDIVEFAPHILEETVLESVMHRFNTVQRERNDNNFRNLYYDEILYDDYEIEDNGFSIETRRYNAFYVSDENRSNFIYSFPANIAPEGYYYQAHYKIPLKFYKTKINSGAHTIVKVSEFSKVANDYFTIKTKKNYYPEINQILFIYDRIDEVQYDAMITNIGGDDYTNITITCDKIIENNELYKLDERYIIFKPNVEKPDNAYELNDGSGVYVWRDEYNDVEYNNTEIGKYTFTNGAHYINKGINFHLRRQDPDGRYGLSHKKNSVLYFNDLTIDGYYVDYSNVEIDDPEDYKLC